MRTAEDIKAEAKNAGKRAALECGCPKQDQEVFVNAYALGYIDGGEKAVDDLDKRLQAVEKSMDELEADEEVVNVNPVS